MFACFSALASTPTVDIFLDFTGGNSGDVVTTNILDASTHGTGSYWEISATLSTNMWVTNRSSTMSGTITCNGTNYSGSTRGLAVKDDVNGAHVHLWFSSRKNVIVLSCFLTPGVTNHSTGDLYDMIGFNGQFLGQTSSGVVQLDNSYSTNLWNFESQWGGTKHSAYIEAKQTTTYWVSAKWDGTGGVIGAYFYTNNGSGTWVESGHVTNGVNAAPIEGIRLGVASDHDNFDSHTVTYYDDVCIDWSTLTWPFLPLNSTSSVNINTLRAGVVQRP